MTAKLVLIKDNKPIDQFPIESETLTIGRKSDCDITIKDPAVSGNHARIVVDDGMVAIEDAGSTNGVHIGGKRVERQILKPGEVVTIGEHQLKFLLQKGAQGAVIKGKEAGAAPAGPSAPTEIASLDESDKPSGKQKAEAGHVDVKSAYLMVKAGKGAGDRIELQEALTTIGEPGIQVAAVSKRPNGHFIIHVDGGKDKNKVPLVNGEPTGFKSRQLAVGDVIEVAGIQMEYCGS